MQYSTFEWTSDLKLSFKLFLLSKNDGYIEIYTKTQVAFHAHSILALITFYEMNLWS